MERKNQQNKEQNKFNWSRNIQNKYCSSRESGYPVKAIKGDVYKYLCVPCRKTLSCKHQNLADVNYFVVEIHTSQVLNLGKNTLHYPLKVIPP